VLCTLYSLLESNFDYISVGRQDEFRAWREVCKRCNWKYEYLAFSLATKQAIVRVKDA
jgi:hypothetical protein